MRALVLKSIERKKLGATDFPLPEHLVLSPFAVEERPEPLAGPGEAVVRIKAAAVNPLDVRVQAGLFPGVADTPLVLGAEGAGIVESSGRLRPGSRAMVMGFPLGISRDGTHQEAVAVPEEWVHPMPDPFSFEEGASLLVAYVTAQLALTCVGPVVPEEYVFVTGATGSIGRAVVQLARAQQARPIAIVSSAAKAESVRGEGPAGVVDLSKETAEAGIMRVTDGRGAALGVDPVGGKGMGRLISGLRRGGALACVGYIAGKLTQLAIPYVIGWSRTIVGVDLFESPPQRLAQAIEVVCRWGSEGKIRPRVDCSLPVTDFARAFERVASRHADGKVVLRF